MAERKKQQLVKDSIRENILEQKVRSVALLYGRPNRIAVTIKIPSRAIENGRWISGGAGGMMRYPTCTHCGFYRSSGSSNMGKNFPDVWFPFLRVKESMTGLRDEMPIGWLEKASGLNMNRYLMKALKDALEIKEKSDIAFLDDFMEKFSHWWQIQMTCAIVTSPNSLLVTHPILQKLRIIALSFDFDIVKDVFIPNDDITKLYNIGLPTRKLKNSKEANAWLSRRHALCSTED
jgi:hypothetical protein